MNKIKSITLSLIISLSTSVSAFANGHTDTAVQQIAESVSTVYRYIMTHNEDRFLSVMQGNVDPSEILGFSAGNNSKLRILGKFLEESKSLDARLSKLGVSSHIFGKLSKSRYSGTPSDTQFVVALNYLKRDYINGIITEIELNTEIAEFEHIKVTDTEANDFGFVLVPEPTLEDRLSNTTFDKFVGQK